MTDKQIIIDASQCEWRTGVEHCGDYECMLNKCCDYNCDWYKRRKLEQKLQAKEQECEELKDKNSTLTITREKLLGELCITEENLKDYIEHYNRQCEQLDQLKQTLTEIKEIAEREVKRAPDGETFARPEIEQILEKISEGEDGIL
jgi:chromosome segregation ATPase